MEVKEVREEINKNEKYNQPATPTPQEMIDIDTGDEGDIEEEEDSGQDEGEVDSDSDFMWDQETIPLSSTNSSPITSSSDGHGSCSGKSRCHEEKFCRRVDQCSCIKNTDSQDTEANSVQFLGQTVAPPSAPEAVMAQQQREEDVEIVQEIINVEVVGEIIKVRPVVLRCAMAHPDFGRLGPPNYYRHSPIPLQQPWLSKT